jgi:FlaA1/EpsC-like NDP-sugar epimerase
MFSLKKTKTIKTIFFVLADIFLISCSVWLAFFLRFDFNVPDLYIPLIYRMIFLAVLFTLPAFYFNKLYSFSWSYVSTNELVSLFFATTVSFFFVTTSVFVSNYSPNFQNFPRSTLVVSYVLVFLTCGFLRMSKRIYKHIFKGEKFSEKERTIIVGAGDAGEQILRSVLSSKESNYFPVGFVDDNLIKQGVSIHGVKVFGRIDDLPKIIKETNAKKVIIALPSAKNSVIQKAVHLAKTSGARKIKIAPSLREIIRGSVSFKNLKDVDVEDLLGRQRTFLDAKDIEGFLKNKTVMITGAAGSIGSELSRQVFNFSPQKVLLLDQDETGIFNLLKEAESYLAGHHIKIIPLIADITDKQKIDGIFEEFKPNIIFHAAAYKHVPLMQENPDEAVKNNVFGTKILAESSVKHSVEKFVFISTDKAVNPTSVMGATKRTGEMICQAAGKESKTKFVSVRFGNVLNSRGSVIPIFREQISKGGPVEVTHPEMKRYFMLNSEACLLVMQAGAMGKGGEVFVLDMGEPVKIVDLAKDMIKLSGFEPDKDIAIVFVGTRPGEKLFEEILTAEEGTQATQNKKIFIAKIQSKLSPQELAERLGRMEKQMSFSEKGKIPDLLKEIVLNYDKGTDI